jgi:hypothetical protein
MGMDILECRRIQLADIIFFISECRSGGMDTWTGKGEIPLMPLPSTFALDVPSCYTLWQHKAADQSHIEPYKCMSFTETSLPIAIVMNSSRQ